MIDLNLLEDWLSAANARYRAEAMAPSHRPFRALSDFTREFNCSVTMDSALAKTVFDWFYAHSQPDSHAVGSLFTGAFYFDACFWPLNFPVGYGTFSINALECLATMPESLKVQLSQSRQELSHLVLYAADCCDYGYGIDDIRKVGKLNERALAFLRNGDGELVGAVAQLLRPRPIAKATMGLRMAVEIFLKALLIQEQNLTERQLKKLGHKIEDIAGECFAATRAPVFDAVAKDADVFPEVSDRYDGEECPLSEVWRAVCVAQTVAAAVVRQYTDRDMRSQIIEPSEGR